MWFLSEHVMFWDFFSDWGDYNKKSDLFANILTVGPKVCWQWSGVVWCSGVFVQRDDTITTQYFHEIMHCHKTQHYAYEHRFIIKNNGCIKSLKDILILKWVMNKYMGCYFHSISVTWNGMNLMAHEVL